MLSFVFFVAGMLRLFTAYTALIPLDGQWVSTYTGSHFSLGRLKSTF